MSQQLLPGRKILLSGVQPRPCKRPSPLRSATPSARLCRFWRLSKKLFSDPPPNGRKLCFRLHHRRRSHEKKCNRQILKNWAESPAPYGLRVFHSLSPLHDCNPNKQAIHFEKTPPHPYCHWAWSLETPPGMERCLCNVFAFLCKTLHKMKSAIDWEAPQPAWARALIALP